MPGMITVMRVFRHAVTIRIYEGHVEESHLSPGIHAVNIPLCGVTHRLFWIEFQLPWRKTEGLNAFDRHCWIDLPCISCGAMPCALDEKATISNSALLAGYGRRAITTISSHVVVNLEHIQSMFRS